jgi:capsular polysaccharide biosynthesis protein
MTAALAHRASRPAPPLVRDIREIGLHHASRRAPRLAYTRVAPAGRSTPRPPLFLLGQPPELVLWDLASQLGTPEAGCYALDDALVAPTGIAIRQGVAFHADAFLHPRPHVVSVCDRLNAEKPPVRRVSGKLAVIYGPAAETYGHWLTDFLPRLWVLQAAGHALETLRFLMPPDLPGWARDLLLLCGIAPEQIEPYRYFQEVIRADQVLMPTGLRLNNRFAACFDEATRFWISRLPAMEAPGDAPKRMFLSRNGAPQSRAMLNRAAIEAVAGQCGLEVVRPEALAFQDQVALFRGAEQIFGEYGSALHNSVFSPPGARVCALRGTSRHPSFVQSGIAHALRQDVGYVFGHTGGQHVEQRFWVDEAMFRHAMDMMAN